MTKKRARDILLIQLAAAETDGKPNTYQKKNFMEALKIAVDELENKWIPVTFRRLTKAEREKYDEVVDFMYTCKLPNDGDDVLITTFDGRVEMATYVDDEVYGGYFDGYEDEDDVIAWRRYPEAWKGGKE